MLKLESARLRARLTTMDDVGILQMIFSDPEAMRFFPATKGIEETREWIRWVMRCQAEHGYGFYIWESKQTGEFVGHCGFGHQSDVDGRDEVELGCLLVRTHWRAGLASEMLQACQRFAVTDLKLSRLIALVKPHNEPARRMVAKIGFVEEKRVMRWGAEHIVYAMDVTR